MWNCAFDWRKLASLYWYKCVEPPMCHLGVICNRGGILFSCNALLYAADKHCFVPSVEWEDIRWLALVWSRHWHILFPPTLPGGWCSPRGEQVTGKLSSQSCPVLWLWKHKVSLRNHLACCCFRERQTLEVAVVTSADKCCLSESWCPWEQGLFCCLHWHE